jgi:hypothetical protein
MLQIKESAGPNSQKGLRLRASRMFLKGFPPSLVATSLGLDPALVGKWWGAYKFPGDKPLEGITTQDAMRRAKQGR